MLLDHLISELSPAREIGYRYANADPVTGQAAWYDLRVRVERAEGDSASDIEESQPQFDELARPDLNLAPDVLRYGESFRKPGRGN